MKDPLRPRWKEHQVRYRNHDKQAWEWGKTHWAKEDAVDEARARREMGWNQVECITIRSFSADT